MSSVQRRCIAVLAVALLIGNSGGVRSEVLWWVRSPQEARGRQFETWADDPIICVDDQADQGRLVGSLKPVTDTFEQVARDSDLPKEKRDLPVRTLNDWQRELAAEGANPVVPTDDPPQVRQRQEAEDRRMKRWVDEAIENALALDKQGRNAEAREAIQEAIGMVNNNAELSESGRNKLKLSLVLRKVSLEDKKSFPANPSVTRTYRSTSADIPGLPPYTERIRAKDDKPVMGITTRERALLGTLAALVEADFKDEKFQDVVRYLQTTTGQPIVVDADALKEAGVSYEASLVNYPKRKATLRSVLKQVLGDLGLTYIVKDESIFVTTPARAKETLTTRTHYVGDLLRLLNEEERGRFDRMRTRAEMMRLLDRMRAQVRLTIEPDSWEERGGPGWIYFDGERMVFVVRQTAEVQLILAALRP